jgi:TetR/AcrR family transcriptional repressor of nem operon
MEMAMPPKGHGDSKTKLLDATLNVIRAKGYAATTVEDICHAAGVTKGSFFHHFKSKDELAVTAARHWGEVTGPVFATAPYRAEADPLARVMGYIRLRAGMLEREVPDFTCLLGTLVQEVYATHPEIRAACDAGMSAHTDLLIEDIEEAKAAYAPEAPWSPESLGYYIQAVLQGSFIFAKAKGSADVAKSNLKHLEAHVAALFKRPATT